MRNTLVSTSTSLITPLLGFMRRIHFSMSLHTLSEKLLTQAQRTLLFSPVLLHIKGFDKSLLSFSK
jgi:hypothetical protein